MRDLFFFFHYTVMGILGIIFFIIGFIIAMACYPIYYIKCKLKKSDVGYSCNYFIW